MTSGATPPAGDAGPRRALVTGVGGQDGGLLVRRLLAEGVQVHGTVLPGTGGTAGGDGLTTTGVRLHPLDLHDAGAVARVVAEVEPDEVYHLAALSSVGRSWEEPWETGAVTGLGAVAVFQAARELQERTGREVRVVQASSAEVFGHPDRSPQDESTPLRPVSPYGAAKAYAHHMAAVLRSQGLFVATAILYNHESPQRPTTFVVRKVTAAAARIAVQGGPPLRLGALDVRRDWGWAEDHVDALVRAVRHTVADDFVVATGRTHSVRELVAAAFAAAGVPDWERWVEVDDALVRPAEAAQMCGDSTKARRELGWSPQVPFEEMVRRMVAHDVGLLRAS